MAPCDNVTEISPDKMRERERERERESESYQS